MKSSITYLMTRVALVVIGAFTLQSTQAQWTTLGNDIYYNNGNVGIGTTTPFRPLHIVNTTGSPDNNLALTGPGASLLFSSDAILPLSNLAKIGLATGPGFFAPNSQPGDLVIQSLTDNGNILFTTTSSTNEVFRVASNGNLGIGTIAPTAKLHNVGSVRFESLPWGYGRPLVIDGNGNVMVLDNGRRMDTQESGAESEKITALQERIEKLEKALEALQQKGATTGSIEVINTIKGSMLEVNPNPATSATTIKYSYPSNSTSAFINISDAAGKLIKRIDVKKSNVGTMNFALGEAGVTAGVYFYALEVNGKTISNKRVVLAK